MMHSVDLCSPVAKAQPTMQTRVNTSIVTELDNMEFFWENYHNYHGNNFEKASEYPNIQKARGVESNELQEVLNYVPSLPKQLLPRVQGNKVNFILISTSVDQTKILEKLTNTLDGETSRIIPLSFGKEKESEMYGDCVLE